MDMPADRSEYSYPITNITYHLPESPHLERGEAAAQKAFQRILDSYGENERLADAFQVELDKRTQIANERKAEERRIRVERQRLAREEKRNKKLGKNHKAVVTTAASSTPTTATTTPPPGGLPAVTSHLSVQALAQAFQPRHGRFATAGYSLVGLERRPSIDHAIAASRSSGRSRQSSVGSLHSSSSSTNTTNTTSAHEGTGAGGARMVDSRLSLSASDHPHPPHSPPLLDVHGRHSSHSSHPADRSLSSSPILPLTPSPRLNPSSDTAFGVVALLPSTLAATTTTNTTTVFPTSSTMTFSASGQPNTSTSSFTSPCTNNNNTNNTNTSLPTPPPQQQQHSGSSTLPMRNKRKQAIPVHPSVIKRIPGITFRIQPDLDKHLQVEILKNIDDYQSTTTKDVSLGRGHSTVVRTSMDQRQEDDASQLQASQDLSKVRQSITSSRPGYASLYIPDDSASYDDPYFQDRRETSPHTVALHAAPNNNNTHTTRYHPYQHHSRNGSLGSGHNVSFHTPTKLRSRSSSSANIWAPYTPSAAGLAMLLSDVVAARATLPLSWDNFSTRDCQVNKVVGKHGQDFEQLEAVVQETVARHQAVAAAAQQEADEEIQEDGEADEVAHRSEQKSSTAAAAAAKESSGPSGDVSRKRKSAPVTTPPPPAASPSQASAQQATGSRATRSRTTHQTEGGRPSRAGATDLVEGYDDIERILKEKRQKKREQQKRRDSQSRGVSEATTEGDYDLDIDTEHPRIKEDVDMDDRSALLRGYTESETEGSNSRASSKRGAAKPPSPPHSRQVTPAAKVDLSSSLHHNAQLGGSLSRTPPSTPTRASIRNPQHTDPTHQDTGAESAATNPVSKTRARARSFSTTIPTDAKTNFFESALEMIEAKRRQSIAKKKASAVVNSATTTDSQQDNQQKQQVDGQQQQANRQLEQELANENSQKMMAPNSNIPKSSKLLPGRVLRKPRIRNYDGSDVETDHQDGGLTSASAATGTSADVTWDRDCSSCRLDVTDVDRELWKQARQSGEINLNPKTWGRTAILCSSCRTQYRRHGLRCTQCFYVPVWNPEPITPAPATDEASSFSAPTPAPVVPAVGSLSVMPKPGGTCKRCKAGTWFQEV